MSFEDTYAHEVLQSRRVRAQRAGFWAKVVSFALMLTLAATLQSEPQLRAALMQAGMDGILALRGQSPTQAGRSQPRPQGASGDGPTFQSAPQQTSRPPHRPGDGIKINRFGQSSANAGSAFQKAPGRTTNRPVDAQTAAEQLSRTLSEIKVGL